MPEGRTHGCGKKSKSFSWRWDGQTLHIHREKDWLHDEFQLAELAEILKSLEDQFGSGWFPLANNVERMSKKTEKRGFGMTIFRGRPGDGTMHAQASSYLGVVFESLELATWNKRCIGIEWRLKGGAPTVDELAMLLRARGR